MDAEETPVMGVTPPRKMPEETTGETAVAGSPSIQLPEKSSDGFSMLITTEAMPNVEMSRMNQSNVQRVSNKIYSAPSAEQVYHRPKLPLPHLKRLFF